MTNLTQRSKKTGKYRSAQQAEQAEVQQVVADTLSKPVRVQIQASGNVSQPTEVTVTHLPKKAPIMSTHIQQAESPVTSIAKPSRFARLRAYLVSAATRCVEQGRTFGKSAATLAVTASRAVVSRAKATLTAAVSLAVTVSRAVVSRVKATRTTAVALIAKAKQLAANVVGAKVTSTYNHVLGSVSCGVRCVQQVASLYAAFLNGLVVTAFQSPKFRRYGMVTMVAAYLCLATFGWAAPATAMLQVVASYAELNCVVAIAQVAAEAVAQSVEAFRLPITTVYVAATAVAA